MGGKHLGLRGQALNYAVGCIAGCDFLLFGYGKQHAPIMPSIMFSRY